MDQAKFKLSTSPFTDTPDARLLYVNRNHQEAYVTMRWGVKTRKGLMLVTGAPGTGKTTLLEITVQKFEKDIAVARLSIKPNQSFAQLLAAILIEYNLPVPLSKISQIQRLRQFFAEQDRSGRIVALLLDDAHHADRRLLEELALLTGFGGNTFLQLVFVGRPDLATALKEPGLRLGQQIGLRSEIKALDTDEVGRFIDHRLYAAGYRGRQLFSGAAVEQVAALSEGIPRAINNLCDRALRIAQRRAENDISREIVRAAAMDLGLAPRSNSVSPQRSAVLAERRLDTAYAFAPKKGNYGEGRRKPRANQSVHQRLLQIKLPWVPEKKRPAAGKAAVIAALMLAGIGLVLNSKFSTTIEESRRQNPKAARNSPAPAGEAFNGPGRDVSIKSPTSPPAGRNETTVFLHTSAPEDLSVLANLGKLLRESGFKIRAARISTSPTGGDVRFFFPRDRRSAERIKSTLQAELDRRGYEISLELLQRDGARFQFAAPGKIEVWLPPLSDRPIRTNARTS